MTQYEQWRAECPRCHVDLRDGTGTRLIHLVDPAKDYCISYRCPACLAEWSGSLEEIASHFLLNG